MSTVDSGSRDGIGRGPGLEETKRVNAPRRGISASGDLLLEAAGARQSRFLGWHREQAAGMTATAEVAALRAAAYQQGSHR